MNLKEPSANNSYHQVKCNQIKVTCILLLLIFGYSPKAYSQVKVGDIAPKLTLSNLYNCTQDSINMGALQGNTIILDFWATWCKFCIEDFPKHNELSAKYKDDGVIFIGVTDDPSERLDTFLQKTDINFMIAQDLKRVFFKSYKVRFRPYFVIINKDGKISYRGNQLYEEDIQEAIK